LRLLALSGFFFPSVPLSRVYAPAVSRLRPASPLRHPCTHSCVSHGSRPPPGATGPFPSPISWLHVNLAGPLGTFWAILCPPPFPGRDVHPSPGPPSPSFSRIFPPRWGRPALPPQGSPGTVGLLPGMKACGVTGNGGRRGWSACASIRQDRQRAPARGQEGHARPHASPSPSPTRRILPFIVPVSLIFVAVIAGGEPPHLLAPSNRQRDPEEEPSWSSTGRPSVRGPRHPPKAGPRPDGERRISGPSIGESPDPTTCARSPSAHPSKKKKACPRASSTHRNPRTEPPCGPPAGGEKTTTVNRPVPPAGLPPTSCLTIVGTWWTVRSIVIAAMFFSVAVTLGRAESWSPVVSSLPACRYGRGGPPTRSLTQGRGLANLNSR